MVDWWNSVKNEKHNLSSYITYMQWFCGKLFVRKNKNDILSQVYKFISDHWSVKIDLINSYGNIFYFLHNSL